MKKRFCETQIHHHGEQNRAHDAGFGFGVLPARPSFDVQSGPERGSGSGKILQVDSVQARRGFGAGEGVLQAR